MRRTLFDFTENPFRQVLPFKQQLLKWIGSKQRFAHEIASFFPSRIERYFEPFLGSAAVLGALAPAKAVGSDVFKPLMEIWQTLQDEPTKLKAWYAVRRRAMMAGDKVIEYENIKASYNANPNGADLLFLCRSCYGGVVRFRKADGYMSTPWGDTRRSLQTPFHAGWTNGEGGPPAQFKLMDYREAMGLAAEGDLVYCDPPYKDTQTILYGAQTFNLKHLFEAIARCKSSGVYVVLSIDGTKRSGDLICDVPIPNGLFEREVFVTCGRSMLRRFQMVGQTLEREVVANRLLLTY